ncbi:hypothetical protein ASPWEDRAFT_35220 [Aspergillus wentii DTO 134E9]|uniref:Transcription factor domain-containing protein n=1 Tax=Aspergillus wentii DTO 134E9 TaxID=1073089 RepID=A0A1L9S396_ASPWE|nr:uncharacterized protein ASPWEDRAFT_35220 [Aspergillus wentii DTO 134E9]OJJ41632.1 hypothetical protein ASPWEDRAFT_35220 [Aspergillus wentii DTO 134E9]
MGKVIKAQIPSSTSSLEQTWQSMPTRKTADVLVQNYFRTMELPFPIFHICSFNVGYERSWSSPSDASPTFLSQLLLVMYRSAILSGYGPEHQLRQARQWASDTQ